MYGTRGAVRVTRFVRRFNWGLGSNAKWGCLVAWVVSGVLVERTVLPYFSSWGGLRRIENKSNSFETSGNTQRLFPLDRNTLERCWNSSLKIWMEICALKMKCRTLVCILLASRCARACVCNQLNKARSFPTQNTAQLCRDSSVLEEPCCLVNK
jgi:hypothetical protein